MEALCGTGFTILLAAISPAKRHFDETANTLSFAAKCGSIPRQLADNEPEHQRELRQLQETVKDLQNEIAFFKAQELRKNPSQESQNCASLDFSCPGSVDPEREAVPRADLEALRAELQRERLRNASRRQAMCRIRTIKTANKHWVLQYGICIDLDGYSAIRTIYISQNDQICTLTLADIHFRLKPNHGM